MLPNFSPKPSSAPPRDARVFLKRAVFFGLGLLLLFAAVSLMPSSSAEITTDNAGAVAQSPPSSSFRPGYLFAFLLLAGGAAYAIVLRKKTQGPTASGPMVTISDIPISQDQRLRLVRCQDEVLLLGITSGGISVLRSYPASEFDSDAPSSPPSAPATAVTPAFSDLLRQAASRYRGLNEN